MIAWIFIGALAAILIATLTYWIVNVLRAADRCEADGGQWVRHAGGGACVQPYYDGTTA